MSYDYKIAVDLGASTNISAPAEGFHDILIEGKTYEIGDFIESYFNSPDRTLAVVGYRDGDLNCCEAGTEDCWRAEQTNFKLNGLGISDSISSRNLIDIPLNITNWAVTDWSNDSSYVTKTDITTPWGTSGIKVTPSAGASTNTLIHKKLPLQGNSNEVYTISAKYKNEGTSGDLQFGLLLQDSTELNEPPGNDQYYAANVHPTVIENLEDGWVHGYVTFNLPTNAETGN
jgi:hypothetical protein